jgi:4-hydroxybenzoate polyprenyltransferase
MVEQATDCCLMVGKPANGEIEDMWIKTRQILEMIRFSHTVFALPFALLAAVMAWLVPAASGENVPFRPQDLVGIVLCMVCARSAAMSFNRLADCRIDADNPRTAGRHLPSGTLTAASVTWFTLLSSAGFVASTLLFLPNNLPLILALPVLLILMGYSYAKRFTALAHFWLGVALMLSPIAAWIAIRGQQVLEHAADLLPAVDLGLAVLMWVSGFDIIYSCQDVDYDREARLHSVPVRLGVTGALRVAALCHLLMVLLLVALPFTHWLGGPQLGLGWIYWTGIIAVGLLLLYEHAIVRPDDLTRVNIAFFNVNAMVSMGLFLLVSLDLLIS